MVSAKCLICFCTQQSKLGKGRKFYKIPEYTKCRRFSDDDKVLIEKRRRLWMKLVVGISLITNTKLVHTSITQ